MDSTPKKAFTIAVDDLTITGHTKNNHLELSLEGPDYNKKGCALYTLMRELLVAEGYDVNSHRFPDSAMRFSLFVNNYSEPVNARTAAGEVELILRQMKSIAETINPKTHQKTGFEQAVLEMRNGLPKTPVAHIQDDDDHKEIRVVIPEKTLRTAIGIGLINAAVDRHTTEGAKQLQQISSTIIQSLTTAHARKAKSAGKHGVPIRLSAQELRSTIRTGLQAGLHAAGVADIDAIEGTALQEICAEIEKAKKNLETASRNH